MFEYWWKMCIVGIEAAIYLVMNNKHHYGMGAFSQEIHEGLNADCKHYCSNNNVPNIHWVTRSCDFFDLKFIGPVYIDTIDWKKREQIYANKESLLWKKGVSDRKWREAKSTLLPKCKQYYQKLNEMQAGEQPHQSIKDKMNKNKSYYQSLEEISNQNDRIEFIQNNNNDNTYLPTKKKTRKGFFKQLMKQSQENDQYF